MHFSLIFLVFAGISCCAVHGNNLPLKQRYESWRRSTKRNYPSPEEEAYRFGIFKSNLEIIDGLNGECHDGGMVFKENKFADMSPAEFRKIYLMPTRAPVKFPRENSFKLSFYDENELPESFDWANKGKVTKIHDQGSAGTCWAFSAVQNIEGQWAMKGMNLTELSVEQVVDCDGMEDAQSKKADCGVFGGWPYLAYQYINKEGGITSEADYPYCCGLGGGKGTCFVCPAPGYNKTLCGPSAEYCKESESCNAKLDRSKFVNGLKVDNWRWFGENETEIAQHLLNTGPLSVAMNAASLQFYHSGIYNPVLCDPEALDHAVLITGYGQKTVLGITRDYWIVKNSWGEKWGENGYFKIARGKGKCGINTQVTTAILG